MGAHERFFDLNDSDSDSDDMDMLDPLPTLQPTVELTPPGPTDKIADEPEEQPRAREVREATEEESTVVGAKRRVGSSEWSAVRLVTAGHDHSQHTRAEEVAPAEPEVGQGDHIPLLVGLALRDAQLKEQQLYKLPAHHLAFNDLATKDSAKDEPSAEHETHGSGLLPEDLLSTGQSRPHPVPPESQSVPAPLLHSPSVADNPVPHGWALRAEDFAVPNVASETDSQRGVAPRNKGRKRPAANPWRPRKKKRDGAMASAPSPPPHAARERATRPRARQRVASSAVAWKLNDRCEARYRAQTHGTTKLTFWYPGIIARASDDGTRCDVDYDDGDKEEGVPLRFLRLPSSAHTTPLLPQLPSSWA